MNIRLVIALVAAGALAFACSPRSRSTSQNAALASALPLRTTEPIEHARKRDVASTKTDAKLDSRFEVTVAPTAIHFALGVKNVGRKHVELTFRNGQSYDFIVVDKQDATHAAPDLAGGSGEGKGPPPPVQRATSRLC